MFRSLPILVALSIAGCTRSGTYTVDHCRIGCNTYGTPAVIWERIDTRPPRRETVAAYRYRHVLPPTGAAVPVVVHTPVVATTVEEDPDRSASSENTEELPPLPPAWSRAEDWSGVTANRSRSIFDRWGNWRASVDPPRDVARIEEPDDDTTAKRVAEAEPAAPANDEDRVPPRTSWLFNGNTVRR